MIRFKTIKVVLSALVLLFSTITVVKAQQDGTNTFSPYSMYGFGHIESLGGAVNKSMAGTGVAILNPVYTNAVNPASLSAVPRQTFLFSLGGEGINDYVQSKSSNTSNNTFNLSELSFQFPLAKRMGFALVMNPYSYVGYETTIQGDNESFITNVGPYSNKYKGTGGTNLLKASLGWEPVKGLSIGASALFYHSFIERQSAMLVDNMFNPNYTYRSIQNTSSTDYTKVSYELGAIYAVRLPSARTFNIGVTYQPEVKANLNKEQFIETVATNSSDSSYYNNSTEKMAIPERISAGLSYNTPKVILAADYIYQDYTSAFSLNNTGSNVTLTSYQDFRLGFSFTPNRYDIRKAMNRWTYRAGARYGNSYLAVNNNKIEDYSLTLGVGMPLQKSGLMHLNASLEVGQRGSVASTGFKETYLKFALGVNFFVMNEWFIRHKFQ